MQKGNRECYKCGIGLNETNATPSVNRRGFGACNICQRVIMKEGRVKDPKAFMLYRIRGGAKVRGILCSLEREDIPDIPEFCPEFPWIKLEYKVGEGRSQGSPSIDRIDSSLGYIKGNVRIISDRANALKSDATNEELIALGKSAARRRKEFPRESL